MALNVFKFDCEITFESVPGNNRRFDGRVPTHGRPITSQKSYVLRHAMSICDVDIKIKELKWIHELCRLLFK